MDINININWYEIGLELCPELYPEDKAAFLLLLEQVKKIPKEFNILKIARINELFPEELADALLKDVLKVLPQHILYVAQYDEEKTKWRLKRPADFNKVEEVTKVQPIPKINVQKNPAPTSPALPGRVSSKPIPF